MRVLGVDPGLTRCGLGVVDAHGRRARLVDVKVAATTADTPTPQRLQTIADALDAIIAEHAPHAIALERVFAQNNVRTVMGTAQASGVVMLAAARHGLDVALYTPSEVKAAVTGDGRAQKAQVGYMVARVLGLDAPPTPADAADALAIAITHAWRGVGSLPDAGQATARTAGSAQGDSAKNGDSARTSAQPSARERWAAAEAAARRRG